MRIYHPDTGELLWSRADSGGQSWAAGFSPDSRHIIWSSSGGRAVQVHDVTDGRVVSTFHGDLQRWCRHLKWHPTGNSVAFSADKHVYAWRPFNGSNGTISQHFVLDDMKNSLHHLVEVVSFAWMNAGQRLAMTISDGTHLIYDFQTNRKELFLPTQGF